MHRIFFVAAAISAGIVFLASAHTSSRPEALPVPEAGGADSGSHDALPLSATPPATPAAAEPSPPDRRNQLALPDGTFVAPLNGVERPALLPWPPYRPWSPIIGKETDPDGLQWYRHADGSSTTTRMDWHPQLARLDPVTIVLNPVAPARLLPTASPSFSPNPNPQ